MKNYTAFVLIATFFGALTFLSNAFSQASTANINSGTMENYVSMGDIQMVTTFDNRYEGVKGTPLLYEDWTDGYVLFKDKKAQETRTFKMNINMFEHVLHVVLFDGKIGSLPSQFVGSVHFKTEEGPEKVFRPMLRKDIEGSNYNGLGYYEVIHEGDILLIKQYRKTFKEADYKGAYSADIRYDEYQDEKRYFISVENQAFERIKLKSKQLESVLSQYDVKNISKKEKLNLSKEEDVKTLLTILEKGS